MAQEMTAGKKKELEAKVQHRFPNHPLIRKSTTMGDIGRTLFGDSPPVKNIKDLTPEEVSGVYTALNALAAERHKESPAAKRLEEAAKEAATKVTTATQEKVSSDEKVKAAQERATAATGKKGTKSWLTAPILAIQERRANNKLEEAKETAQKAEETLTLATAKETSTKEQIVIALENAQYGARAWVTPSLIKTALEAETPATGTELHQAIKENLNTPKHLMPWAPKNNQEVQKLYKKDFDKFDEKIKGLGKKKHPALDKEKTREARTKETREARAANLDSLKARNKQIARDPALQSASKAKSSGTIWESGIVTTQEFLDDKNTRRQEEALSRAVMAKIALFEQANGQAVPKAALMEIMEGIPPLSPAIAKKLGKDKTFQADTRLSITKGTDQNQPLSSAETLLTMGTILGQSMDTETRTAHTEALSAMIVNNIKTGTHPVNLSGMDPATGLALANSPTHQENVTAALTVLQGRLTTGTAKEKFQTLCMHAGCSGLSGDKRKTYLEGALEKTQGLTEEERGSLQHIIDNPQKWTLTPTAPIVAPLAQEAATLLTPAVTAAAAVVAPPAISPLRAPPPIPRNTTPLRISPTPASTKTESPITGTVSLPLSEHQKLMTEADKVLAESSTFLRNILGGGSSLPPTTPPIPSSPAPAITALTAPAPASAPPLPPRPPAAAVAAPKDPMVIEKPLPAPPPIPQPYRAAAVVPSQLPPRPTIATELIPEMVKIPPALPPKLNDAEKERAFEGLENQPLPQPNAAEGAERPKPRLRGPRPLNLENGGPLPTPAQTDAAATSLPISPSSPAQDPTKLEKPETLKDQAKEIGSQMREALREAGGKMSDGWKTVKNSVRDTFSK